MLFAPASTLSRARLFRFARRTALALVPMTVLLVAARPAPRSTHASASRALPRVVVTATEYKFTVADTVSAGPTEIVLRNSGKELHHLQFIRLEGGHTIAELGEAMKKEGPPPAWAVPAGGPNSPAPGGESVGIVNLRAGRYAVVCFIPAADQMPHVAKGMLKELIVRPGKSAEVMPEGDVSLTLADYSFTWSRPLTAGKHLVSVINAKTMKQPHEVFIAKLAPGKKVADVLAFAEKMSGPPPMMPMGGTVGLVPGDKMVIALDATPGEWVLLCFLPDAKDGKPHVAHGMVQQFTVK